MNYYALQVKTRSEETYMKLANQAVRIVTGSAVRLIFPRKSLPIRKEGAVKKEIQPVFSGYVFIETEDLSDPIYWALRTTPGFYRFLPDNQNKRPLEGRDLATLKHFISFGPVAEASKVWFDENDRIHIAEGPLKGLEGRIIKVDKRKRRVKVKLDIYDESFPIDLAFEEIGKN
jgi:transcriptional antiterminator NusG